MQRNAFISAMLEKHLADWDIYYPRMYDYAFPTVAGYTGNAAVPVPQQTILTVEQDAPFVICGMSAELWNDDFLNMAAGVSTPIYNPTDIIADMTVQIFDSGASNFLSNSPLPIRQYMGQAGDDSREFVVPYMVERNTNLTASLLSADSRTFDVTLVAHGFKILRRLRPVNGGDREIARELRRG